MSMRSATKTVRVFMLTWLTKLVAVVSSKCFPSRVHTLLLRQLKGNIAWKR
ncbi:unnamed protein product [Brassica oleracea var. botrytis]